MERSQTLADIPQPPGHFLFGNAPDVVCRVKDPEQLAELCAALNIPHPEVSFKMPVDPREWLVKSAGGAGGSHVAPAGAVPEGGLSHPPMAR